MSIKHLYKTMFEKSIDGFIVIKNDKIIDCNSAALKLLNYTDKKDFINLEPSDLSPEFQPDGRLSFEKVQENTAVVLKEGHRTFEWVHAKSNGENIWIEVVLTDISQKVGEIIFLASWRDISIKKELEQNELFLNESLIQSSHIINENVIYSNTDLNGIITEVSQAFCNISGYHKNELIGKHHSIVRHKDMPDILYKELWETIQADKTWSGTIKNRKKDGSHYWVRTAISPVYNDNNLVVGYSSVRKDITAEIELSFLNKNLENRVDKVDSEILELNTQFEESNKLAQEYLDIAGVLIMVTDNDHKITLINQEDLKILGHDKEEIIGKTFIECFVPDRLKQDLIQLTKNVKGNNARFPQTYENYITTKSGQERLMKWNNVQLKDENGVIQGTLTSGEDITEARENQTQLMRHNRLAQMGEMISMIAHQWRQPLGSIAATSINLITRLELDFFDLTKEDGREDFKGYFKERLNKINFFVKNLTTTIDDFRNFYKPDKKSVKMSFHMLVKKTLTILETQIVDGNIKIIQNTKSKVKLDMYDNEMMQVILNIFTNAMDSFKENDEKNPTIEIEVDENGISIFNNGSHIKDSVIDKIFDPYFSTKSEKNGTGLGLYMSRIIVEEHHNGSIEAMNKENGVCFKINLNNRSTQ